MKRRIRLLPVVLFCISASLSFVHGTEVFDSPGPGYREQIRQHEPQLRRPSFDIHEAIKRRWPAIKADVEFGPATFLPFKPSHVLERERLLLLRTDSQPLLGEPIAPSTVKPAK